jgi:hypothetical protein
MPGMDRKPIPVAGPAAAGALAAALVFLASEERTGLPLPLLAWWLASVSASPVGHAVCVTLT